MATKPMERLHALYRICHKANLREYAHWHQRAYGTADERNLDHGAG